MEQQILKIAIGQQVAEILNLKTDVAGRVKTDRGIKSIEGLGGLILAIVQEQTDRLKE